MESRDAGRNHLERIVGSGKKRERGSRISRWSEEGGDASKLVWTKNEPDAARLGLVCGRRFANCRGGKSTKCSEGAATGGEANVVHCRVGGHLGCK